MSIGKKGQEELFKMEFSQVTGYILYVVNRV